MRALRRLPGSARGRVKNRVSLSTCAKRAVGSASSRGMPLSRTMRAAAVSAAAGACRVLPPSSHCVAANTGGSPAGCAAGASSRAIVRTQVCTGPDTSARHGSGGGPCAACTAASSSASSPSPSAALTGTTGMPSARASPAVSTDPPPARSASITFSASTTGTPSSSSCSVRYRLRAGHVASAMLMTASAAPPSR